MTGIGIWIEATLLMFTYKITIILPKENTGDSRKTSPKKVTQFHPVDLWMIYAECGLDVFEAFLVFSIDRKP